VVRAGEVGMKEPVSPIPWLMEGILPAGVVVLLSGREGSMKSWLALSWAPCRGRRERVASVLTLPGGTLVTVARWSSGRGKVQRHTVSP
jgi:hypothetical protein